MLKALVIVPNDRTKEFGCLLAVARAEARKRERSQQNPPIRALKFFPELNVYVAVYEAQDDQKREMNKSMVAGKASQTSKKEEVNNKYGREQIKS
jgi:hypothetical protein